MMTMMAVATAAPALADSAEPLYDLVDASAQRLQTADAVAANKWITGGPITDQPASRWSSTPCRRMPNHGGA